MGIVTGWLCAATRETIDDIQSQRYNEASDEKCGLHYDRNNEPPEALVGDVSDYGWQREGCNDRRNHDEPYRTEKPARSGLLESVYEIHCYKHMHTRRKHHVVTILIVTETRTFGAIGVIFRVGPSIWIALSA